MTATLDAENLSFARWFVGFAILFCVDILWFAVAAKIYHLEDDFFVRGSAKSEGVGTVHGIFFIGACAVVGAFTLACIEANTQESGEAGALVGFTIFFVFNACVYYIINNMRQIDLEVGVNQKWYPLTAVVDTVYGTSIYALACIAINSA